MNEEVSVGGCATHCCWPRITPLAPPLPSRRGLTAADDDEEALSRLRVEGEANAGDGAESDSRRRGPCCC